LNSSRRFTPVIPRIASRTGHVSQDVSQDQ
jgi:hypothetical protein